MPLYFKELEFIAEQHAAVIVFERQSQQGTEEFSAMLASLAANIQEEMGLFKPMGISHTDDGTIVIQDIGRNRLYRVLYSAELRKILKKELVNFHQVYRLAVKDYELTGYLLDKPVGYRYNLRKFYKILASGSDIELMQFWKFCSLDNKAMEDTEDTEKFTPLDSAIEVFEEYFAQQEAKRADFLAAAANDEQKPVTPAPVVMGLLGNISTVKNLRIKEAAIRAMMPCESLRVNTKAVSQETEKCKENLKSIYQKEEEEILAMMSKTLDAQMANTINEQDEDGYTIAMYAADKGFMAVFKQLKTWRNTVDLNAQNRHTGCTALMYAVDAGHDEIVKFLLKAGVRIDLLNKSGESAITKAAIKYRFNHRICVLLSQTGKLELVPGDRFKRHQQNIKEKLDFLPRYVLDMSELTERRKLHYYLFAFYQALQNGNNVFARAILKIKNINFNLWKKVVEFEKYYLQQKPLIKLEEKVENNEAMDTADSIKTVQSILAADQVRLRSYRLTIVGEERQEIICRYLMSKGKTELLFDLVFFFDTIDDILGALDNPDNAEPVDSWVIGQVLELLGSDKFIEQVEAFKTHASAIKQKTALSMPATDIEKYGQNIYAKIKRTYKYDHVDADQKAQIVNFYLAVLHRDKKILDYYYKENFVQQVGEFEKHFYQQNSTYEGQSLISSTLTLNKMMPRLE